MKLEKISYEEAKKEEYKGFIFIECNNCKNIHKIPKPKIENAWRKFCICGKVIVADYKIVTPNAKKVGWNDYLYYKKIKEIARVYKPNSGGNK